MYLELYFLSPRGVHELYFLTPGNVPELYYLYRVVYLNCIFCLPLVNLNGISYLQIVSVPECISCHFVGIRIVGALTIRPPTNRPRDISTHTIRPPDKPSAVTFYYCDIPSQGGQIVRPPKIVTFRPSKFGRFVTVCQTVSL